MAPITMPDTLIVGVTPLLATHHSGARSGSTHGIPVASIIAFWTIHGLQTLWVSREPQVQPFCLMRILKVLSLTSMLIWVTNGRSTRFVAGRNGSSCALCSGTEESGHWNPLTAPRGMPSSECFTLCLRFQRKFQRQSFHMDHVCHHKLNSVSFSTQSKCNVNRIMPK